MKNYTKIPNEIFEKSQLSISERYLFGLLLKYCGNKDFCYPSQKTLARITTFSERYVRKLLKKLEERQIIYIKRTGFNKTNTYKVSKDLMITPYTSSDGKSEPCHIGTPVPLYTGTLIPPKNTYTKGKDKINVKNLDGLESARKKLIKKGFDLRKSSIVSYKLIPKK